MTQTQVPTSTLSHYLVLHHNVLVTLAVAANDAGRDKEEVFIVNIPHRLLWILRGEMSLSIDDHPRADPQDQF